MFHSVCICIAIRVVLRCRKLIHHRKETLARRSSSSSGPKQGLPSSSSEISLSQTPPPPNGLSRDYGRQGSMPLSGSMDNMQGEPGFYQVTHSWKRLMYRRKHLLLTHVCHLQPHSLNCCFFFIFTLTLWVMSIFFFFIFCELSRVSLFRNLPPPS